MNELALFEGAGGDGADQVYGGLKSAATMERILQWLGAE